jgi:hypothetical protein
VAKESKSWTVLLVGELGNIVSFRLSKALVMTLIGFLATVLALGLLAVASYQAMRSENNGLERDLEESRADLLAADEAKDRALVNLLLLEAELRSYNEAKRDKTRSKPPPDKKPPALIAQMPKPPAALIPHPEGAVGAEEKPAVAQPTSAGKPPAASSPQSLSVGKLKIWQEAQSGSVKFQFSLRNVSPQGTKIRGYTFIVLKPEDGGQEPLRVSPWTPLKEDGSPAIIKRGQYFSIARFKFVNGTFPDLTAINRFKTATVYVYSEGGSLVVEKAHEVDKILRS